MLAWLSAMPPLWARACLKSVGCFPVLRLPKRPLKQNTAMLNIPTAPKPAVQALSQDGLRLLSPADLVATLAPQWQAGWSALSSAWDRLPPDAHLKDGGHYRRRRHSCFIQDLPATEAQGWLP
ncbi:hypothetical protein EON64_08725, partial [archaeon]